MESSELPTHRKKLSQNKRRTEQRRRAFEEQKRNPGLYVPIPVGRQKNKKEVCGKSRLKSTWVSEKSSENSEPAPGNSLHVPEIPSLDWEIAPILLVPEIPSPDREIALYLLVPEIPSSDRESALNFLDPGNSTPDREICRLDEALRLLDAVLTPVKPVTSKEASPGIQSTDDGDCITLQASPLLDSTASPPRLAFFYLRPIKERIRTEWSDSYCPQHRTDPSLRDRKRTRPPPRWSPRKKQALDRVFGPSAVPSTSATPTLPEQAQRPKNYRSPKRLKSVIIKPDPPTASLIRQLFPEAFRGNKRGRKP